MLMSKSLLLFLIKTSKKGIWLFSSVSIVDDTFVIFRTRQEAEQFLTFLNSRHNKISFTMETEENNQIFG